MTLYLKLKFIPVFKTSAQELNRTEDLTSDNSSEKIKQFFQDILSALDKKEESIPDIAPVCKIPFEFHFLTDLMELNILEIIKNIEKTASPLSEEILIIKKAIGAFIKELSTWKEELNDAKKGRTFDSIMVKYNKQNEEFKDFTSMIKMYNNQLDTDLSDVLKLIDSIYQNSGHLQSIAEKVKILSFNASIESARTGEHGKGFKIIAQEIKKLSDDSQKYSKDILVLISQTKQVSEAVLSKSKKGFSDVGEKINQLKSEFDVFYQTMKKYYDDFNKIFYSVEALMSEINIHIGRFSPIFQMHDIIIQQLGNFNKISQYYKNNNKDSFSQAIGKIGTQERNDIINRLIHDVEKIITTDMEIEALKNAAAKYGLKKEFKLRNQEENKIEFF